MTAALAAALACIERDEPAILVEITEVLGSAPRGAGTVMLVTETATCGTIGGGELEWRAMQRARDVLAGEPVPERLQLPLGPALQQCCGGHVTLALTRLDAGQRNDLIRRLRADRERLPRVVLFGAGHVGQALARALEPLPFRLWWLDGRPDLAPAEHVPELAAVRTEPQDLVLVMTHSHALDLAIVEARLRAMDFAWLGLIGSATKRRRFEGQLMASGIPAERLARLVCPIGLAAIKGKEPAVIAVSVAAQLLTVMEAMAKQQNFRSVA
jgi:xanthine dehydrogenase accessory protein XdhC